MPKRVDANQKDLVELLRALGASVQPLHTVGKGTPDALIGYKGRNLLAEIKNPEMPPSARKLTPDEKRWHSAWKGQVAIIETEEDVMTLLGLR